MDKRTYLRAILSLTGTIFLVVSGCESLQKAGVPGLEMYAKQDPAELARESKQREAFIQSNDHDGFFWLLSNRIHAGMQRTEVEQVLGQSGEPESDLRYFKKENRQTTDSAFRWGPDNKGNSVVLFFRDGRLLDFNPDDFAEVKLSKKTKFKHD